MAKRLEREFGRYDVDALDSEEYLGMPRAIRNEAYLYLLVLSGRSRKRLSDGLLTRAMADDLARRMRCSATKLLGALREVGMVTFDESEVFIVKYAKWQQTRAEIEEVREERRAAGRSGGIASGLHRRSKSEANHEAIASINRSKPEANGEASATAKAKQNEAEIEIEKEIESYIAPRLGGYTPPEPVVLSDDPALKLALWWHEFIGRQISEHDRQAAAAFVVEYPRLGLAGIKARITEHAEWRRQQSPPLKALGKLEFYRDALRDQEARLADQGVLAPRQYGGALTGLLREL